VGRAFWASAGGEDGYEATLSQVLGWNSCHPPLQRAEPGEVLLQVAARDKDRKKLERLFAPQLVPRVLGTVPGITYLSDQGRPRVSEVVGYWPALIGRDEVPMKVVVGEREIDVPHPDLSGASAAAFTPPAPPAAGKASGRTVTTTLGRLCLARSGDKGDTANVGVLARSPAVFAWMREHLTEAFVKERFADVCQGDVERFEVPNLLALNFLLHESLGGGGTLSLLVDAQGKTYSQYLLASEVEVDTALLEGLG
jgi:hypothetical protein